MSLSKIFCAIFFFGVLAHAQQTSQKDVTVAVVGSKRISLDEFNRKYNEVRLQTMNPPSRAQFLEDLVRYEIGLQEAERRKLNQDPIVQERMRQEMYKALLEKELGEKVQKNTVSEKEMQDYYKRNPEIRTSHILIELKSGATAEQREEARKRANEIYEEVKKSKRPFEELVKLYSDDTLSKQSGGDVGYQNRVTLVPNYYDTALAMKVGEIRGLIETQFGFHIIKVTGRRAYDSANKMQLRAAVFDEKRRAVFDTYFNSLKKNYKIETNSKVLQ